MVGTDPLWMSVQVRTLIADRDVGGLIRFARQRTGWRQTDLGRHIGCSAATISRLERNRRTSTDLDLLRKCWDILAIPAHLLGAAMGLDNVRIGTVASTDRLREGGPVRRREFVAGAAGLVVPVGLLRRFDEALAVPPSPSGAVTVAGVRARLAAAQDYFDRGELGALFDVLPRLLSAAQEAVDQTRTPESLARAAACYNLATHSLVKVGRYAAGRITADRAARFAAESGSVLADAAAAWALGVVLRHEGRPVLADQVTLSAAGHLDASGLSRPTHTALYVQMLCTCAYSAGHAGDRERALESMGEAERAAGRLAQGGRMSAAQVALYRVGVHWSLGDAGAAVRVGARLHPAQFATAERRGRLHTDLARAWWLRGDPEQAARSLLLAHRESPAEVRDRPAIRGLATTLVRRHPRTAGVAHLAALTPGGGAPAGRA
jgi:transcriptional regulator with XRE-family HTH domain